MSSAKTANPQQALDAITLLKADHEAVAQLFAEHAKTRSASSKKALVQQICIQLSVHAQIEEEIFYPEVKAALKDKLMVPEGLVEHAAIKNLVAELEAGGDDSELMDAKVKVLSEYVSHHVKEEHSEMFPKAKASSLDMQALGSRLAARRQLLLAQHSA